MRDCACCTSHQSVHSTVGIPTVGLPVPIVAITLGVKHDDYFITQSTNASSPGYDVIRA